MHYNNMKRFILILTFFSAFILCRAQGVVMGAIRIDDIKSEQCGDSLRISMDLDVSALKLSANRGVVLSPTLEAPGHVLELDKVEVLGRNLYIWKLRNKAEGRYFRRKFGTRQTIPYSWTVRMEPWMETSVLYLSNDVQRCCKTILEEGKETLLALDYRAPEPEATPVPEPVVQPEPVAQPEPRKVLVSRKESISGTAYVGFPVNRWDILENFRNNRMELGKIRQTIESVLGNPDITIDRIILTGYASPEGAWSHNEMLAENRTKSVRQYVMDRYGIGARQIEARSGAEDWSGLRDYVQRGWSPNKYAILDIIDSGRLPDEKEALIRSRYPSDYRMMYEECYPTLRHTDYIIEYTITTYEEKDEND